MATASMGINAIQCNGNQYIMESIRIKLIQRQKGSVDQKACRMFWHRYESQYVINKWMRWDVDLICIFRHRTIFRFSPRRPFRPEDGPFEKGVIRL